MADERTEPLYWMNTVSLEHVQRGVEEGYTQADQGSDAPLRQLRPGDRLAFYSPRTARRSGVPLRQFTALATVTGAEPFQANVRPDFQPWRIAVRFETTQPADVGPLLERLSFITDVQEWSVPFRQGLFEITAEDFAIIRAAMAG